ncbi:hypothetical protein PINS_up015857 [Pythium insidiosum]|nr:hypothetical protein PINS_up015857 [Pythium insidiosum]
MAPFKPLVLRFQQHMKAVGTAILFLACCYVGTDFFVTTGMSPAASLVDPSEPDRLNMYPEELFDTDWSAKVPDSEIMHLSVLHHSCMKYRESVIPWNYGIDGKEELLINQTDPNLMAKLRQCPDVDVFIPTGLRGHGYCEDALAYTKYLKSRMITTWVLEAKFVDEKTQKQLTYHDLCPDTPVIVFNHYWTNIRDDPNWPKRKKIFMMPNIEMHELGHQEYWHADVILCKTAICARTSLETKNFKDTKFVHTVGGSTEKGTARLLDCWLSRPDLPPLYVYIGTNLYNNVFKKRYGRAIASSENIHLHADHLDVASFSQLYTNSSFFVCPSLQEGYGHYINQARAAGAFVITPDVPPMNELITPSTGELVKARRNAPRGQFLGGNSDKPFALRDVPGFFASFTGADVCAAVDEVLFLGPAQRRTRAERARRLYFYDLVFFKMRMEELRAYARGTREQLRGATIELHRQH